ncbi:MAG: RluA family pseudouridine synthase [Bacteroidetes bacterium]|nr:RluA family pseudouridine synthase [Bacteroidota bacterium]
MENEYLEDDELQGGTGEEQGDDLVEQVNLTVDKGQQPLRIDKFVHSFIGSNTVSRSKIQNAADAGSILVNGKPVKSNYKVRPNDNIVLLIPRSTENYDLVAEDIPLDIAYEDDALLLVNKDPMMVVHPGLGNYRGTLINALMWHFKDLPNAESQRPGLVHRIDKGTSGLLVIAKTEFALAHLAKQFFNKTSRRKYLALVWGDVKENEGTIVGNIGRHSRERKQFEVYPDGDHGKPAITHYKVIERLNYVTLVECHLETGRTHQIRVHMKYIGHTLFNDTRYGGNKILKGTVYSKYKQFIDNCFEIMPRQALHAATLGFVHPTTGKQMDFDSPLPADFKAVLDKWRKYWTNPTLASNLPEGEDFDRETEEE